MFYDNFLNLCNKKGISPSAAAIEMGFQKSVVTRWKKSVPTEANRRKIAQYFGVSVETLMAEQKELAVNGEGKGNIVLDDSFNENIIMIARAGKKMTNDQAESLRKYAQFMFPEAFEDDN